MTRVFLFLLLLLVCSALFQSSNSNGVEATPTKPSSISVPHDDDTVRVDPLNSLKKYRGGFNVTNKHYWSSTLFSGIYGCALALLWLVFGFLYGGFKIITASCCKRSNNVKKLRFTRISAAIFFTVLATVCTGLILGANLRFLSRAKKTANEIFEVVNGASRNIHNVTEAMRAVSTNLTIVPNADPRVYRFLVSTSKMLDSRGEEIRGKVENVKASIDGGLKIAQLVTILTMLFNLVAVVCLSVFGVLRMRPALRLFLVLCWFLVIIWLLLFGVYFAVGKIEGDTCRALRDFQRDPNDNVLSSLLPCKELVVADSALHSFSKGVHNLVNRVNARVTKATGNFVRICNPFSAPPEHHYQPEKCKKNTMTFGQAAHALRVITCHDSTKGTCIGGISIRPSVYKTLEGYLNSLQSIIHVYPDMKSLAECQPIKDVFSGILNSHCQPLKSYTKMVWVSMVVLAITTMSLLLIWIVEAEDEQERQFSDAAVKPCSMELDLMEAGLRKEDKEGSSPESEL